MAFAAAAGRRQLLLMQRRVGIDCSSFRRNANLFSFMPRGEDDCFGLISSRSPLKFGQLPIIVDTSKLVQRLIDQGVPSSHAETATSVFLQAINDMYSDSYFSRIEMPAARYETIKKADFSKSKIELINMIQNANVSVFESEVKRTQLERDIEHLKEKAKEKNSNGNVKVGSILVVASFLCGYILNLF